MKCIIALTLLLWVIGPLLKSLYIQRITPRNGAYHVHLYKHKIQSRDLSV